MDPQAPYRTDAPLRAITLTGKLFPWDPTDQQPLLLPMHGTPDYYLACFSEAPKLRAMMTRLGITVYTIKQIDDGYEFRSSIPSTYGAVALHVILDPYFRDNGLMRFTQVIGRE